MSKKSKAADVKTQKARRQKKIAAVLGALLIVVLIIQVPRTLNKMHDRSATPATPVSAPVAASPIGGSPTAIANATGGSAALADSDLAPTRTKSQLLSFATFKSKDPFVQQVVEEEPAPAAMPAATPTASSATAAPATGSATTTASSTPTSSYTTVTAKASKASQPTRRVAAVVEVNSERESVAVSEEFPKANPTFRLVSVRKGVAMIGLAGGNYASGAQTVALRLGRTLTLVNTADRTRYELRLVSAS
jgi:hypothetical protein